jgi:tRNA (guanine-N7-)-methyltransferase
LFPEKNFIGVDIKGNRLWVGATYSLSNNLTNAAFLRTQIDKIDQYFAKDEVDEIWITFPDPQLRLSKANKRLTHPKFFRLYHLFLKKDGLINLKTDSPELYKFTNTVIELYGLEKQMDYDNLYKQQPLSATLKIQTHYEKLDIAKSASIFYLRFSLPEIIPDEDKKLEETLKQVVHER